MISVIPQKRRIHRCWLFLFNALPMLLDICLFRMGGYFDLLIFPVLLSGLTVLNILLAKSYWFLLVQSAFALYTVIGGYLSTMLYTRLISNDGMSYGIGKLFVFLEVLAIAAVTVITLTARLIIKLHRRKKTTT